MSQCSANYNINDMELCFTRQVTNMERVFEQLIDTVNRLTDPSGDLRNQAVTNEVNCLSKPLVDIECGLTTIQMATDECVKLKRHL